MNNLRLALKVEDQINTLEDRLYHLVRGHLLSQGIVEPHVYIDLGQPVIKVATENNNTVVNITFIKE